MMRRVVTECTLETILPRADWWFYLQMLMLHGKKWYCLQNDNRILNVLKKLPSVRYKIKLDFHTGKNYHFNVLITELQRLLRYDYITMDTNMTATYYVEKNAGLRLFYLSPIALIYLLVKVFLSKNISWTTAQLWLKLSGSNYWIPIDKWLTFGGKLSQDGRQS